MRQAEHERKFDIEAGRRIPALPGFELGAPRRLTLTATYLDTPDLRLTRGRVTLRRRTGGDDAAWHLKLPAGGLDASAAHDHGGERRTEVHAPLTDGPTPAQVPAVLRAEVEELLEGRPLVPVAVMRTARTQREIRTLRGCLVGLLTDDTVRVGSWRPERPGRLEHAGKPEHRLDDTQRWRELEIELADSSQANVDALETLTAALAEAGVPVSTAKSKVGRFLAARVEAVEAAERSDIPAAERPAIEPVLDYITTQLGVLQAREADVVSDTTDAVHKTRVAARRLRSALRTSRRLFEAEVTEPLRVELRWWGHELGGPRDAEVFRETILSALDDLEEGHVEGPVRERVVSEANSAHASEHRKAMRAMRSRRYRDLMIALAGLVVEPPVRGRGEKPAAEVLPGVVAKAVARVDKRLAVAEAATSEDERLHWLHETRKAAKAARYLGESLVPVFGSDAEEVASRFEQVTETLGEVQDTVVAVDRISAMRARAARAGEPTATYDELIQRRLDAQAAHDESASAALSAVSEPAFRAWFGG